MTRLHLRRRTLAALAATALALTACGSDDGDDATTAEETSEPEASEPEPEPEATSEEEMAMEPQTYEVTGTDYAYTGIPTEMAAGSTISFSNASDAEVHEIVSIYMGDDDTPLFDLLTQMDEAMQAGDAEALAALDTVLVNIQGPGGEPTIPAVGDGTLAEPGRYIFLCAIQQGVDPQAYFAELQRMQAEGEEGPVVFEDGGQPHAALGMVAETQVVAAAG